MPACVQQVQYTHRLEASPGEAAGGDHPVGSRQLDGQRQELRASVELAQVLLPHAVAVLPADGVRSRQEATVQAAGRQASTFRKFAAR